MTTNALQLVLSFEAAQNSGAAAGRFNKLHLARIRHDLFNVMSSVGD